MSSLQSQNPAQPHLVRRRTLSTMFEEDFERCYICQQPCKGLYCSSECKMQDKGVLSPATRPTPSVVKLTSRLPPSLSPLIRPVHHIQASPNMPAQVAPTHADYSSSSSSSSPLQSPASDARAVNDSPPRGNFNLPPPAYPATQSHAFAGSVPIRIPGLLSRASVVAAPAQAVPGSHGSPAFPHGSVDTLRFGRIPGTTNSVISPKALGPRCACGRPAGHPDRPSSRERAALDSGFSHLALGPSVQPDDATHGRSLRMTSDTFVPGRHHHNKGISGQVTPSNGLHTISDVMSGSLLSRSRSDPIPPTLQANRPSQIAPNTSRNVSAISPRVRDDNLPLATASNSLIRGRAEVSTLDVQPLVSPRRGRSRGRDLHTATDGTGVLNQLAEREQAPSRSRHRRDEAKRDEERLKRQYEPPTYEVPAIQHSIMPSWSRRNSTEKVGGVRASGEGVTPRRVGNAGAGSGQRSPNGNGSDEDREGGRKGELKQAELRRASKQLGAVFGVAAG